MPPLSFMNNGIAVASFRRSDNREKVKRGEIIYGESAYIAELHRVGLIKPTENRAMVAPETKVNPCKAAGKKSPASQAAQASPKSKSKKSKGGATQAQTEACS